MAVRKFQAKNGLKVDGIAGPETLAALGLPTGQAAKATSAQPSSNRNLDLLAHLVYGEARGEPYIGQVAVAAVVLTLNFCQEVEYHSCEFRSRYVLIRFKRTVRYPLNKPWLVANLIAMQPSEYQPNHYMDLQTELHSFHRLQAT